MVIRPNEISGMCNEQLLRGVALAMEPNGVPESFAWPPAIAAQRLSLPHDGALQQENQ